MIHLLRAPLQIWATVVASLPGPSGDRLRYRFWSRRLAYLGARVRIGEGAFFQNPAHIRIEDDAWIDRNVLILAGPPRGDRITRIKPNEPCPVALGEVTIGSATHIAPNCVLSGMGGLAIGKNCGIASNSSVYSFSHHYRNLVDASDPAQYSFTPRARNDQQAMLASPVVIGDYCAVGLNSVLLPGTRLERGTWVASGTVVRGSWGPQATVFTGPGGLESKSLTGLVIKE